LKDWIQDNVTAVFISLLVGVIVTGVGMIIANNTSSLVLREQYLHLKETLDRLNTEMTSLKVSVIAAGKDRWTKSEHRAYENQINERLRRVEDKVDNNTTEISSRRNLEERVKRLEDKK
jgi:gas vesicle protein